jgi:hypothetical protein
MVTGVSSLMLGYVFMPRRPGFDSRHYQKKKVVGPLSLVRRSYLIEK